MQIFKSYGSIIMLVFVSVPIIQRGQIGKLLNVKATTTATNTTSFDKRVDRTKCTFDQVNIIGITHVMFVDKDPCFNPGVGASELRFVVYFCHCTSNDCF